TKTTTDCDVSSVVFYGVNLTIPLISLQVLKIPKICKEYMRLIAHIVEFYPDKLGVLPAELLNNLFASLEYGIEKYPLFANIDSSRFFNIIP
ncbi:3449_t:CDS:2, partial [Racocetra persica]